MSLPFTRRLSLLFSGELSKILINLLAGNLNTYIDEIAYGKLIETLRDPLQKHPLSEIIENLLKNLGKGAEWSKALRTQMVLHELIHKQGSEMSAAFSSDRVKKLLDSKLPKKCSLKRHEIEPLLPAYVEYLQNLVQNYDLLGICFSSKGNVEDTLLETADKSLLQFICKGQNLLSSLLKIFPLMMTFLAEVKGTGLLKQTAYFCLTDAYNLYSYLNSIISLFIKEIFNLSKDDAISFYQVYVEHIQITRKFKESFDLRNHVTDFYVSYPNFYQVDAIFNTQVELYIVSIKRGQFAKREKNCSLDHPEVQNLNENTSISPRESNVKSLCEISHTLARSLSQTNKCEKQSYMPPKFFTRKQNINSLTTPPRVKVRKPTNKFCAPESNPFLKKCTDTNQNLLKVPTFNFDMGPCTVAHEEEGPEESELVEVEPVSPPIVVPVLTEKYALKVSSALLQVPSVVNIARAPSSSALQVPNEHVSQTQNGSVNPFNLMVPQMKFYNSQVGMGSCRSLQNLTPTQSLGGSFADTISVENLS